MPMVERLLSKQQTRDEKEETTGITRWKHDFNRNVVWSDQARDKQKSAVRIVFTKKHH